MNSPLRFQKNGNSVIFLFDYDQFCHKATSDVLEIKANSNLWSRAVESAGTFHEIFCPQISNKIKFYFHTFYRSGRQISYKVESGGHFQNPTWTPISIWRSETDALVASDVQYNIDSGRHYGCWWIFAMQKRSPNWTPAAINYVHLEVCVAVDGLISITFENL